MININHGEYSSSFYFLKDNKIALAEISIFPIETAIDFLTDSNLIDKKEIATFTSWLHNSNKIYFFNRLNVPPSLRNQGIATELLQELKKYLDETNSFLINTANAYGDKNQEELIAFYQKNGMRLIHDEGGLFYHPNLKKTFKNSLKILIMFNFINIFYI